MDVMRTGGLIMVVHSSCTPLFPAILSRLQVERSAVRPPVHAPVIAAIYNRPLGLTNSSQRANVAMRPRLTLHGINSGDGAGIKPHLSVHCPAKLPWVPVCRAQKPMIYNPR
nr:hypothetical protein CFP56_04481 [Quercus suber]